MLLIVQCDCGDQNADLIACARYTVQLELQQFQRERIHDIHVVFLIQLPCIAGGCFTAFQVDTMYDFLTSTMFCGVYGDGVVGGIDINMDIQGSTIHTNSH